MKRYTKTNHKSAITGRYVAKDFAQKHPRTTYQTRTVRTKVR